MLTFVRSLVVAASLSATATTLPPQTPAPLRSTPTTVPSTGSPSAAYQQATRLEFNTPLAQFIAQADSRNPDLRFDWVSDGCSVPLLGSSGKDYDFTNACRRHDFAYRNLVVIDGGKWWNSTLRSRVDTQFKADMHDECGNRSLVSKFKCLAWAEVYYRAVRIFGR